MSTKNLGLYCLFAFIFGAIFISQNNNFCLIGALLLISTIIAIPIWLFLSFKNAAKQPPTLFCKCINGKPELVLKQLCVAQIIDNAIIIKEGKDTILFRLPITDIAKIEIQKEFTTLEEDKSVIGRAIVGGLLLGPVGAIVGGISGTGIKKTTTEILYLSIDYVNNENITLEACGIWGEVTPTQVLNTQKFYESIAKLRHSELVSESQ